MLIRIDKYLADAGLGTRSAVQELLRKGRVRVNGETVKDGKLKIDPDTAEVTMDGKPVCYEEYSYYIFNKPAGILSASRDKKEKTVIDLIPQPRPRELFPVGRLDRDTVGLLLITNDGDLSHRLLSPGKHVPKTYRVMVRGRLPENAEQRFAKGIDIGDEKPTAPAKYVYLGEKTAELVYQSVKSGENGRVEDKTPELGCQAEKTVENGQNPVENGRGEEEAHLSEILLTLTEGRYHEVKRMISALGCEVVELERISMGGLELPGDLPRGGVRKINSEELKKLLDFEDRV